MVCSKANRGNESVTEMYDEVFRCDDSYSVGIVRTWDRFLSLRETWDTLVEQHGSHHPFLCHDWFRIWLKHFQGTSGLFIAVVTKDGIPVLIAPLLIINDKYKNIANARKIEFIGNHHSPIKCFIFGENEKSQRTDSLIALFRFFKFDYKNWDILELDSIPVETFPCCNLKDIAYSYGFSVRDFVSFNDWYFDAIDHSSQAYFSNLPKKIRDELKRRQKRLEEYGSVNFFIGKNQHDFRRHMDLYDSVRSRSWKHPEKNKDFLSETREMFVSKGLLRCCFVTIDDTPIAAQLRIVSNGTAYFMEALYDKHYKNFGLGNLLRWKVIQHLIDIEKVSSIDQIRGDEDYKEYWTPFKRNRIGVTVFNTSLKGQFIRVIMMAAVPVTKKIKIIIKLIKQVIQRNQITTDLLQTLD